MRDLGHLKARQLSVGVAGHVVAGQHGGLAVAFQDHIDDVGVVINTVVRCGVGSATQRPRRGVFHHVPPLSSSEPVLAADDDDVAVVGNVGTDDVLADGEGDGLGIHVSGYVNASGRSAAGFCLNGLHRSRLSRAADGHFPRPVRVHLCVGTGEHRRTPVGRLALVHVNLHDLMAEAVGQAPNVGHLAHGEDELSVPSTLSDREVGRIPEAPTVRRVEVGGQRVDVVAIPRFVAHRIVEFEEGDPFFEIRENHFGRGRRRHLGIHAVAVRLGISP